MTLTTVTSQQFNRDNAGAKKAAAKGPVFITTRGEPSHVLLSIEEYQRIANKGLSIAERLASHDSLDDFEFPRIDGKARSAEF